MWTFINLFLSLQELAVGLMMWLDEGEKDGLDVPSLVVLVIMLCFIGVRRKRGDEGVLLGVGQMFAHIMILLMCPYLESIALSH